MVQHGRLRSGVQLFVNIMKTNILLYFSEAVNGGSKEEPSEGTGSASRLESLKGDRAGQLWGSTAFA